MDQNFTEGSGGSKEEKRNLTTKNAKDTKMQWPRKGAKKHAKQMGIFYSGERRRGT
jgi:hypothetical protein